MGRVVYSDLETGRDTPKSDTVPKRIQRRRTKGWRMPAGAVYVGRPTKWGNPYPAVEHGCIALYREWIESKVGLGELDLSELRGKDLACWCRLGSPCHADILLAKANK